MSKNQKMSFNKLVDSANNTADENTEQMTEEVVTEEVTSVEEPQTEVQPVEAVEETVTDTTGTQVVKEQYEQMKGFTPVVDTVETVSTISPEEDLINKLIASYIDTNNGVIMGRKESADASINAFKSALQFGLDFPTQSVLDAIYRLFKEHRDKILAPDIVFPGIINNPSKKVAERLSCMYTLFRMLTAGGSPRINTDAFRNMLAPMDNNKIDMILLYFDTKSKI